MDSQKDPKKEERQNPESPGDTAESKVPHPEKEEASGALDRGGEPGSAETGAVGPAVTPPEATSGAPEASAPSEPTAPSAPSAPSEASAASTPSASPPKEPGSHPGRWFSTATAPSATPPVRPYPFTARSPYAAPARQIEAAPLRPARLREYVALFAAVVVADALIYSGGGFAGLGAFFILFPIVLLFGAFRRRRNTAMWVMLGLTVVMGLRMIWLGSEGAVVLGVFLLFGFSMALTGLRPFLLEGVLYSASSLAAGIGRLRFYGKDVGRVRGARVTASWLVWAVPLVALLVFGGIFVLANPVLRDIVSAHIMQIIHDLNSLVPAPGRLIFWVAMLWVAAGLLRPCVDRNLAVWVKRKRETVKTAHLPAPLEWVYPMARNTFGALIVLFAVYLVFELYYLWFREFPKGFYYSGYAHRGAAWLTFALALATAVMGVAFQGRLLRHPSLARLKRLAWIWSAENFILAVCVFHRTQIYVDYNGMSPLRVVALFGIAVVVAGFVLVVVKVARGKNFLWLVRRQVWAFMLALILLALTPVDWFVTRYNVNQVLSGNPAPIVQITSRRINPTGLSSLLPLLKSDNPTVRKGVAALLAQREHDLLTDKQRAAANGWSSFQLARANALNTLASHRTEWTSFSDAETRAKTLEAFRNYGRQWYD